MNEIHQKLLNLQVKLKCPKDRFNKFGGFYHRNCEDILEALKPLLQTEDVLLTVSDDVVCVGERVFVKATATLIHKDESVSASAYAREALTKKGMDDSQITGAASSYARKYALGGLFLLDDTKDADSYDALVKENIMKQSTQPTVRATENHDKYMVDKVKNAKTMSELKSAYIEAVKIAGTNNDLDLEVRLNQAKNERKEQLLKQTVK